MDPNLVAFRARFPEFEKVKDPDIQVALDDASAEIQADRWSTGDYPRAILFFAAHVIALRQSQISVGGGRKVSVPPDVFVRSVGFGERRVMFGERQVGRATGYRYGPGDALFEQTIYGQRFLALRERNIAAVRLV